MIHISFFHRMVNVFTISEEDFIRLAQCCGVSHDLSEILKENAGDAKKNERASKHLDYITVTLEDFLTKHLPE